MTREDLMREATALVERMELELPGYEEPVTVGFRRNGAASFFFGADLVIQFNGHGQLRRVYAGGRLIKAEQGSLVSMERVRGPQAVELRSRRLSSGECSELLKLAENHLTSLLAGLDSQTYRCLRQVPPEQDILARIHAWLANQPPPLIIANSANVDS